MQRGNPVSSALKECLPRAKAVPAGLLCIWTVVSHGPYGTRPIINPFGVYQIPLRGSNSPLRGSKRPPYGRSSLSTPQYFCFLPSSRVIFNKIANRIGNFMIFLMRLSPISFPSLGAWYIYP